MMPLELLKAVQLALNTVRNTGLRGCPGGFKDTYELAAEIDRQVKLAEQKGAQE